MKSVNPYLNFPGNTEEAFTFYRSIFGGDDFPMLIRFREFGPDMAGPDGDKIAHMALPVGQNMLMATDALEAHGQTLTVGNNVSIQLEAESVEEAERVFAGLSDGGTVKMPLAPTEWAERYGMCVDRYGIGWMVNYAGTVVFRKP